MELKTLADTEALAQTLVDEFVPFAKERPLVIGINGPLGAGKTTFVQAIGRALDIAEPVTSPTYTYLEEYSFVFPGFTGMLHHVDAWRVEDEVVFDQLKIGDLVQPGTIVVVEWFDQIKSWLEKVLSERGARLLIVNVSEKNGDRRATFAVCEYTGTPND